MSYTPTTDRVRDRYVRDAEGVGNEPDAEANFDRWLRQVKAEAWDEGRNAQEIYERQCWDQVYSLHDDRVPPEPVNPYRDGENQ